MDRAWHAWDPGPLGRVNQLLPTGEAFVAPPSIMPLVRLSQTLYEQQWRLVQPGQSGTSTTCGASTATTSMPVDRQRRGRSAASSRRTPAWTTCISMA